MCRQFCRPLKHIFLSFAGPSKEPKGKLLQFLAIGVISWASQHPKRVPFVGSPAVLLSRQRNRAPCAVEHYAL